jgi:hypothetical protein
MEVEIPKKEIPPDELELMAALKELPPEKIDQIALEMLKDSALGDIKAETLDDLTDYDIEKIIAQEAGRAFSVFLVKYSGERLRNYSSIQN